MTEPTPDSTPRGVPELLTSLATVLAALSLLAWPFSIGPSFGRMFEDFEATLPTLTRMALTPWVTYAIVALLLMGTGAGLAPRRRAFRLGVGGASFLIAVLTHVAFLVAMYLPIWQLAGAIE